MVSQLEKTAVKPGRPISTLIQEGSYNPETRTIHAIKGKKLHCANWQIEGVLRMLLNVLDVEVAKDPKHLIVYGGRGKAARNWQCFEKIVDTLLTLEPNETLVVQSGKPVAVFETHSLAPRVLICNSMLVGKWADWDHFEELDHKGLIMYGQYTAGSWNFIGIQGILQGTYETFAEVAEKHFGGSLKGRFVLTAGMGAMGGAQPLAIKMNRGAGLTIDVDLEVLKKRVEGGWLDTWTDDLDKALELVLHSKKKGEGISVGLWGNAADVLPEILTKKVIPDVVTDQTPAHDPVTYVPSGMSVQEALRMREKDPKKLATLAISSMKQHVQAMLGFMKQGCIAFEYGNNIRKNAFDVGLKDAFKIHGFVQAYIRPMFEEGRGPFRWASLQGNPKDIFTIDDLVVKEFGYNKRLLRWIENAKKFVSFQGLPARVCWLGYGERAKFGKVVSELVASGTVGPIWVGRDHLDPGGVASPYRETEGMKDGSDAVGDWPILDALLNVSSGATWVSVHQGGGQGMGYSISAGFGMVLDGSKESQERAVRVFTVDPGIGVVRHADAGYERAQKVARDSGIRMPMLDES